MKTIDMVRAFHDAFGVDTLDTPALPKERAELRLSLLKEELSELEEAINKGDIVEALDALTDLQYVLDGTYLEFGFGGYKSEAFSEVHYSNMSKLGEDGKPIYREDGKILKGPNYWKPNLKKMLRTVL